MPFYRSVGEIPRKRHTQFRRPDGGLYREELMGTEGFSSDSALLYHMYAPTDLVAVESWDLADERMANHPLLPRLAQTHKLDVGRGRGHRPPPARGQPGRAGRLRRRRPAQPALP